jgi:ABC-type transporter Mla maintaining outer membrane lipid asymmetry ATPase subunit MlaF
VSVDTPAPAALPPANAGAMWACGPDVHFLPPAERAPRRRKFGMVFQMASAFDSLTVVEDGAPALPTENVDHMKMTAAEKLSVTSTVVSHDQASASGSADRIAMIHGGLS